MELPTIRARRPFSDHVDLAEGGLEFHGFDKADRRAFELRTLDHDREALLMRHHNVA